MFKILSRSIEWRCNAVYYTNDNLEAKPCEGTLRREDDETIKCDKCEIEWSPDDIEA